MSENHKDPSSLRVPGFRANGIAAGIKTNGGKDLALIVSDHPARAAAVFTTNSFKAAPVLQDMRKIVSGTARAIIVNSGCANAATGEQGVADAGAMARVVSSRLGFHEDQVLVASTGSIGKRLPLERIEGGADELVAGLREEGMQDASEAIMTTDRFPKTAQRSVHLGGRDIRLCGIAKGAGMIEPNMATMLAFFFTDAVVDGRYLDRVFRQAMDQSFNAISVDGCMSTNDTAIILANGAAGNDPLKPRSTGCVIFREALFDMAFQLARLMVRDGEGATKLIDIRVEGCRNRGDAKRVAYAIGRSSLVKTAFFGGDPNWGRIISAVGSTGVPLHPEQTELHFNDRLIFKNGTGVVENHAELESIMKEDTIAVLVNLNMGGGSFRLLASDLTHEYIDINAFYHT
ncbi:MAG: bifunctional glutamate N-acetyltransferase/amino-acid acetyltransferase ArgJ [Syntrophales bacterium]|jgi:glutamate N-acetyltransferase/amino-acid N-acetyltransferase|nr:bifunctional glutamate N-acetyltransferase/amino-acid acetyltransferase ArgJ [Syntrophales bacterium]MCK9528661.1 bifunctional glutamate N-acetyltransferase/amino-acid acetyltransferase ArgJ [Syntrophales bacterium]MDX9922032.1 bifunctional glutamate N-acetyltransferase/amino-acid acetyltransferase ArgJ [Syntrophales bacterium]